MQEKQSTTIYDKDGNPIGVATSDASLDYEIPKPIPKPKGEEAESNDLPNKEDHA